MWRDDSTRRSRAAPPGGDDQPPHLPARPAGHRRRRRHERLRGRARQAPCRARHRGRDLHAGHVLAAAAGRARRADGRARSTTSSPGPFEGLTKGELPGQLCAFAREVLRTEASPRPRATTTSCTRHYWLSGQVGALARDRWGIPLVHSMHTMAKVKNEALAEGDTPEPVGPRDRRGAGRRGRRHADRQHRRRGQAAGRPATTPTRPGSRWSTPASTSTCSARPRRRRRAPGSASPADAHRAGVRRPDPAAEGARRAAARGRRRCSSRDPSLRSTLSCRSSAARPAPAWSSPRRWPSWPRRSASPTWCGSCRRSRAAELVDWYAAADRWSASRRTTSRSGWSRSRPRPSAPRSSPPRSAASRPSSATGTPGCSSSGHDPADYARAFERIVRTPGLRDELSRGAVRAGGRSFGWDADRRPHARGLPARRTDRCAQDLLAARHDAPRRARAATPEQAASQRRSAPRSATTTWSGTRPPTGVFDVDAARGAEAEDPVPARRRPARARVHAFVCRQPDENHEGVYRWLLERNLRMFGVAFAVDAAGDIYLDAPAAAGGGHARGGRPAARRRC